MKPLTLYLSTPGRKEKTGSTKFEQTESDGVGVRFWVKETSLKKLSVGMPVVVVRRDVRKRRAEGKLVKWVQEGWTKHDPPQPRYDIHIEELIRLEPYVRPNVKGTFSDDGGGVLVE